MSEVVEEETVEEAGPRMAKRVLGMTNEGVITVIHEGNPKRAGSNAAKMWDAYETLDDPKTVEKALEANISRVDLHYNVIHGFIEVTGCTVEEYEVNPRGPRTASDKSGDTTTAEGDPASFDENEEETF